MTDIAVLGISVDTRDLKSAKNEFVQFSNAAKVAERAASGLSSTSSKFSSAEIKAMGAAMGGVERASAAAAKALAAASLAAQKAGSVGTSGVKALAQASGAARAQVQNLAYQIQDVGTMLAMGQSPFMLLAQQLPQITQNGGALTGVMAAFKQTLMGLISPLGLLTTGFVLLASGAISYFTSSSNAADKADEAWKQHGEIIKSLKAAFGEAAEGLSDYVTRSHTELAAAARAGVETLKAAAIDARTAFVDAFLPSGSLWGRSAVDQQFMPFKGALEDFRKSARAGAPDFAGLRAEVERLVSTDPSGLRNAGDAIINASSAAADAERKVRAAENAIALIGGTASSQVGGVNELAKALNELAGIAVPALSGTEQALAAYRKAMAAAQGSEDRASARSAYDAALQRISNQDPTVINSDGNMTSVPIPGQKPVTLGDAPARASGGGAKQKAYSAATQSINEQTRALQAQNQAQAALNPLVEDYGFSQARVKAATDLLLAAERDKRALTPQLISDINSLSNAYANQVVEQNKASEATKKAQEAVAFAKQTTAGFLNELRNGLRNGETFWESFGNAALSVLDRITDKLLNDVLDALFKVGGAGSGGGGGGLLSSLFSGLFGGGKSFFPTMPGAGLFESGGYTGDGAASKAAGIVHAGEYVFSASATKRLGVGNLDRMHTGAKKGYQSGGYVTPFTGSTAQGTGQAANQNVHVTVGVSVDQNGNLQAYVKDVARGEAVQVSTAVVKQNNKDKSNLYWNGEQQVG
ncbi:phage tail length tape measure family protein [Agrobacterium tumefaciens]|uniref:phage tail length tape measure family protein n=1 Tax=Agrobacterium tumefaciens TaxID=358 RepID=UPI0015743405|nr:phage tail length tape measure family protein [Agrobacterium tumefaciens]WCJ61880.1 phage tail length tape measure family protein [Agrobacterium tumefaciens]